MTPGVNTLLQKMNGKRNRGNEKKWHISSKTRIQIDEKYKKKVERGNKNMNSISVLRLRKKYNKDFVFKFPT
jgi:hypothetical protein